MPDERINGAYFSNGQVPASLSTEPGSRTSSRQVEEVDGTGSSQERVQSPGNASQEEGLTRLQETEPIDVDTWQGESPSQICLCQPDPKVPRPRNGR